MGLGETIESIALCVVLASLAVGFYETSSQLGEITQVLENMVSRPTTFGFGAMIFLISMDIWTPGLPVSMLPWWLRWIEFFYWFSSPYLPHFSLWVCAFALISSAIVTFILMHVLDWDFWWGGFFVAIISFALGWYCVQLLAWWGIGYGASLIGIPSETAYTLWKNTVEATSPPLLQYFFLATVPLSIYVLARRLGGYLV